MKKTHRFTLTVKTDESKVGARAAVLTSFASRQPDGCEFHLADRPDQRADHADAIADALEKHSESMIKMAEFFGDKPRRVHAKNLKLVAAYRGLLR